MANKKGKGSFKFDKEKAKQAGKLGGLAHKQNIKIRDHMQYVAKRILDLKPVDQVCKGIAEMFPDIPPQEINNRVALIASAYKTALSSNSNNMKAFELLRDTAGEKPADKLVVEKDLSELEILEDKLLEEIYIKINKKTS